MKIVFFGTPEYVVAILDSFHKVFKNPRENSPIVTVVTQPPRPTGRKKFLTYTAVDQWAHDRNVPIVFKGTEIVEKRTEADIAVVASYGEFVPDKVLGYFPNGILNVHPSLLPKWRGTSPVQATILAGDTETGTTIIKLDSEWDHGPIISSFTEEVRPDDTAGSLRERLFARSADFLSELLPNYISGKVKPKEQDHDKAIYTSQIKKADGFIPAEYLVAAMNGEALDDEWKIEWIKDFSIKPSPESIERFVRAMDPWPGAWTEATLKPEEGTTRIKILKIHLSDGKLVLDEVQIEGKSPVNFNQFKEAYPSALGNGNL